VHAPADVGVNLTSLRLSIIVPEVIFFAPILRVLCCKESHAPAPTGRKGGTGLPHIPLAPSRHKTVVLKGGDVTC
jgi:hypothetical protein